LGRIENTLKNAKKRLASGVGYNNFFKVFGFFSQDTRLAKTPPFITTHTIPT